MNNSAAPADGKNGVHQFVAVMMRVAAAAVIMAGVVMIATSFIAWVSGSGPVIALISLVIGLVVAGGGLVLFRQGPSMIERASGPGPDPAGNDLARQAIGGLSRVVPIIAGIIGGLMVVVGTLVFVVGIGVALNGRPHSDGVTTQGVIVDSVQSESTLDGGSTVIYRDVVEYEAEGETYRLTRDVGTAEPGEVGKTYEVSYRPSDPGDGRLVGIGAGVALLIGGLIAIGIGLLAIWGVPRFASSARRYHNIAD